MTESSHGNGLTVSNGATDIRVSNCSFVDNALNGVRVSGGGTCDLTDCVISRNKQCGLYATSTVNVHGRRTSICHNEKLGVYSEGNDMGIVRFHFAESLFAERVEYVGNDSNNTLGICQSGGQIVHVGEDGNDIESSAAAR